jgi:carboxypeptidase C (cathepsin A)
MPTSAVFVVILLCWTTASYANRLVEKDLGTILREPVATTLNGVPIVNPPQRVAGYFSLNRTHDAKMFYFFFESRQQKPTDPVVLWMTGGPGCSSELAVFFENGPFHIQPDLTLTETKSGWDVNSNMIFVDQPINSGFSYSDDERDRIHDEVGVGDDMLDFLQAFFAKHPEFADRDFFVTGESYAGHYVPAVAHRVWLARKNGEGRPINIKGLAIGNGLTDPAIQYGAYADYALENKLIGKVGAGPPAAVPSAVHALWGGAWR